MWAFPGRGRVRTALRVVAGIYRELWGGVKICDAVIKEERETPPVGELG